MPPRPLLAAFLLCGALALSTEAAAQTSANAIQYSPVGSAEENQGVSVAATFNSPVAAVTGFLFVRPIGQTSYLPLPLQVNGNQLQGFVPPSLVAAPGIEYFLSVTDEDNATVTFPPNAPQTNPLKLPVAARATAFALRGVAPSSGTVVADPRPTLRFEENGGGGGLDPATLRVFVDRREVSGTCRVEGRDVLCAVGWDLAPGPHAVTAAGRSRAGQWARPLEFQFSRTAGPLPKAPSPPPVFHGRALAEAAWARLERAPQSTSFLPYPVRGNRALPFLELDADGKFGGETVSLRVEQTSLDRLEQPGPGLYALSLKGTRHELELGDSQRGWTDMGLSPNRIRGVRARGWRGSSFTAEGLGGLTRRAIEDRDFNTATYAQYVYGGKVSASPAKPVTVTAYALETRDDPGSVSINTFAIPVANRIAGAEAAATLPAGFKGSAELAFNRYVSNMRKDDVGRGRGWQAKLGQTRQAYNWTGAYRQTTPAFVSLGNYLVQSDYRGFDGSGMVRGLANRVVVSGSGQSYRDNTEGQKNGTFRLARYQLNVSAQTVPRGPQLLGGFGQQLQTTRFAALASSENRMLLWSAGLSQGWRAFRLGAQVNVTKNRTVVGSLFARDFDNRSWTANASWFGRRGSVQLNGGFTESRDLSSGTRSRNLNGTVRGTLRLETLEADAAVTEGRGRDSTGTSANRQSNWQASATWRYVPKRFWRLRGERASYSDFVRPLQTYQIGLLALAYGIEF